MKKPLPLTGSSSVNVADPEFKKFRAALRKQLLKVAHTHPVASTRALFLAMADGDAVPRLRSERKPETIVPSEPSYLLQAAPSKRAAPCNRGLKSQNAPEKQSKIT